MEQQSYMSLRDASSVPGPDDARHTSTNLPFESQDVIRAANQSSDIPMAADNRPLDAQKSLRQAAGTEGSDNQEGGQGLLDRAGDFLADVGNTLSHAFVQVGSSSKDRWTDGLDEKEQQPSATDELKQGFQEYQQRRDSDARKE